MLAIQGIADYPALARLLELQLRLWPEHERFLGTRFAKSDLAFADRVAGLAERVTDDLERVATDYRWLCERMSEEEIHFRRTGAYRLATFEEANREIYSNSDYMQRYMNGVLLSHIWWDNHARVMEYYANTFLKANRAGFRHLEIGPGHGLLLYFAASDPRCSSATGWDVSETSIAATRSMLTRLGVTRPVQLVRQNLFDAGGDEQFDSIVISEVLEHLEQPRVALEQLRKRLAPGGRIFVNVPINSPAPDHIYLLKTPEEGVELVRAAGFEVEGSVLFPMTGYNEQRARKMSVTISCVVVGSV